MTEDIFRELTTVAASFANYQVNCQQVRIVYSYHSYGTFGFWASFLSGNANRGIHTVLVACNVSNVQAMIAEEHVDSLPNYECVDSSGFVDD